MTAGEKYGDGDEGRARLAQDPEPFDWARRIMGRRRGGLCSSVQFVVDRGQLNLSVRRRHTAGRSSCCYGRLRC